MTGDEEEWNFPTTGGGLPIFPEHDYYYYHYYRVYVLRRGILDAWRIRAGSGSAQEGEIVKLRGARRRARSAARRTR